MQVFLDWWLRQLAEMLPSGLRKAPVGAADAVILDGDETGIAVLVRRRGKVERIGAGSADEAGLRDIARRLHGVRGLPSRLLLRLPVPTILMKRLSLPLAAQSGLEALLGFELDRETPFTRDEVYWSHRLRGRDVARGRLDVDFVVVPRAAIAWLLLPAQRAGLEPAGIEITAGGEPLFVDVNAAAPRPPLYRERALVALAAAAAVLMFVTLAFPFLRQRLALSAADRAVTSLTAEAEQAARLRKSLDRVADVRALIDQQRQRAGSALSTLAAVTRTLPDDTYLTSLGLHDGKLTLTGLSASAANVLDLLAKAPGFRGPSFVSPIVHRDGENLEFFTISVALAPAAAS